jgi:putative SOS response-associated peptidase YedK
MCYDIRYLTKRKLDYAKRYGEGEEEIARLQLQLDLVTPRYYVSGFDHPEVPIITNEHPQDFSFFALGLIPAWAKSPNDAVKIGNQTINAKSETMFEKPAFKEPARNKRCLIVLDGFYEHHHRHGMTFPYHIRLKSDEPFSVAGLWDEWVDRDSGLVKRTISIITTRANALLEKIHNNPKLEEGPRMPVILPRDREKDWLMPVQSKTDREFILNLCQPYPAEEMEAYTVSRLKGKLATGNTPRAIEKVNYPELIETPDLFG